MKTLLRVIVLIMLCATAASAATAKIPEVGDTLPAFVMPPLAVSGDYAALGLDSNREFTIADVATPYIMVEIIGVYCKVCHEQLPTLAKLYKRLKKTGLDKRVTMLGIAAGGTPMEVEYIRKKDYLFPVAHDTKYAIYDKLGDTKTPFTMIVDRQGKVLYTQRGLITDLKGFINDLEALVK